MDRLIYDISIDDTHSDGEDLGMTQIAFTSRPAIKQKGMYFSALDDRKEMRFADKLKMRIAAPVMIPNLDIYRIVDDGLTDIKDEYYVRFSEKVIDQIHSKFMKKLNLSKSNGSFFNLEHTQEQVPAYILECWIVDNPEKDKSFSTYGVKVPKGSLFAVAQVTDQDYFNSLIENEQTGFSIEGFLGMSLSEYYNKTNKKQTMNEDLKLPDGEHKIGDKTYVIKDGKLIEIIDSVEASEEVKDEVKDETVIEEKLSDEVKEEVVAEVKEEELAEEVKEEEVIKEEVKMAIDETELMTILEPRFEEIYKMIADLKGLVSKDVEEDVLETKVELSDVEKRVRVAMSLNKMFN